MKKSICATVILLFVAFFAPANAEEKAAPPTPTVWTAEEAVSFALRNSPDSLIAQRRIEQARATVAEARSRLMPELNLGTEYSQTDNPMYSFGNILNQGQFNNHINFNDPGRTDDLNFKIQASYRLYNGGRDQAAVDAAAAQETGSQVGRIALLHQLGFEVVRLYYIIDQDRETVSARQSALEAIHASVTVAQARYQAGTLLKADLLSLEAQEAGVSEDLIRARHDLEIAKRGFLNTLGLKTGDVDIAPSDRTDQPSLDHPDFSRRPELRVLDAEILAAEAGVRQAEGGRYPTVDGFASYQVDKGTVLDGSGDSWMAGVRVNYSLFDGNRTGAQIAGAQARLAELKERKRKIELALSLELQKAELEYRQADQRLAVTEKMAAVAEESARLNRVRFQEGVILSSELIDGEKRLTDARVRQSVARTTRLTAIANLRRAAGLPQFDNNGDNYQESQE